MSDTKKTAILLMGQTPPPWHGQAVATQLLFEHDWGELDVHPLRMEYSAEMVEVGSLRLKKIIHLFHLCIKARHFLRKHPDSILFYPPASANWIPFLRDVIFLLCTRHLAGSTVFIFHASGLAAFVDRGPLRRFLGKLAYDRADMALEVAKEKLPPHKVFDAGNWQWCPCGIEVPATGNFTRSNEPRFNCLFIGSLQEGKGVLEIIKTAKILKDRGLSSKFLFRVVGKWISNDFKRETEKLRTELGVEDMVELVGQLTGDEKWQAYADADLFFFPSHYASEASPLVLMEALGMGLPIVSTDWAGIPDMLDGCETARLLPIQSPEQYATALAELAEQSSERDQIATRSRRFYEKHFIPERFIDRVTTAFKNLVTPEAAVGNTPPEQLAREGSRTIRATVYLADQNPGYDRSNGISRMSQDVLTALKAQPHLSLTAITSKTSLKPPVEIDHTKVLPWPTRAKVARLLTDHLHPLLIQQDPLPDIYYYPKGYIPMVSAYCKPAVVTIHDTIIQYQEDHYPEWRGAMDYGYWAKVLKHTLREADRIMTVSNTSKEHIEAFMKRHGIPAKPITVTYEPCSYEPIEQPLNPAKEDYLLHLASKEPHKQTAQLVRWWHDAQSEHRQLPILHLVGNLPPEAAALVEASTNVVHRPFLEDHLLQEAYRKAKALILPSEIEGFGLPALEAYYMGTPVCYVKGTSVEEILSPANRGKGGFTLSDLNSLKSAIDEVLAMSPDEIRECALQLRGIYSSEVIAQRIIEVFRSVPNPVG